MLPRSYLFAPGDNARIVRKAVRADADAVIFDLEDSVPPHKKDTARSTVESVIQDGSIPNSMPVFVRINSTKSTSWEADLESVVYAGVSGIRVGKVETGADVEQVSERIGDLERDRGIQGNTVELQVSIESARGFMHLESILTHRPRLSRAVFGQADYATDVGIDVGENEFETLVPRTRMVIASRAAGLAPPVMGAFPRLSDPDALRVSTTRARSLGFFGRSAIHPRQVAVINEVFTPSRAQMEAAEAIVRAFDTAQLQGEATAVTSQGDFVDLPIYRRAQQLLSLAASITKGADHE